MLYGSGGRAVLLRGVGYRSNWIHLPWRPRAGLSPSAARIYRRYKSLRSSHQSFYPARPFTRNKG